MREGSLEAPSRHPVDWQHPDFTDEAKLDAELRRIFDICHGCRRCFNLCASFPRLFNLIDATASGDVSAVPSEALQTVADGCTLCDMCFMSKCPYVPPHPFNLDFPHLMRRARAAAFSRRPIPWLQRNLACTDRTGALARWIAPIANWATDLRNELTRPLLERFANIHRAAAIPRFHRRTFMMRAKTQPSFADRTAPAFGRKVALFATCFANYNNPAIGLAARAVLTHNGVDVREVYPGCCGMPHLEQGDLMRVTARARRVARALIPHVEEGYAVVAPVPSCALMLKSEWPLLFPQGDPDYPSVQRLAAATFDLSEYIVDIAQKEGLAPGLQAIPGGVAFHSACHARAQNIGQKGAAMLRQIPGLDLTVIERCSGHGGTWGLTTENFEAALKVGAPVAQQATKAAKSCVASECPLAAIHICQGMAHLDDGTSAPEALHPIQIMARAYGLEHTIESA